MNRVVIFLAFILLLNCVNTGADYGATKSINNRFIINAVIKQLFELFRNVLRDGDFDKNIPVLDPYEIDHASFFLSAEILHANFGANLTNIVVSGLGGYELGSFKFTKKDLSIDIILRFPSILFKSDFFVMEGNIMEYFPISTKGLLDIDVQNLRIRGKLFLKQSEDGTSILLSRFEDLEFTIDKVKSACKFYSTIDEVLNAMISDLLAGYLSKFSRAICAMYGNIVVDALNNILNKYENWQIIAVIL